MSKKPAIEELYKEKSLHEHILTLPDTYIGSIDPDAKVLWVFNEESKKFVKMDLTLVPGLYKIFDEILVNARDHMILDKTCKNIKVTIDKTTGRITVWNDGAGIRCEIHSETKVYLPQMIFGRLLTSGNYEKKGKIVGGKNGYGAKLANIWSTEFEIETIDSNLKKKYYQKFTNNMYNIEPPTITDIDPKKVKSYTKISFVPDYKRFGLKGLSNDLISLFKKRVYDIASCTDKTCKAYLNDEVIEIAEYTDYINMFFNSPPEKLVYQEINPRWKVGVIFDPDAGFTHSSTVNGIWTFKGGSHLNYVVEQIIKKLLVYIKEKHKDVNVKASQIRDNLTVFIDCVVEDPTFSSQTKEELTSKVNSFGSTCEINDDFIKELIKTGLVEEVVKLAQFKEQSSLNKTDGKKTSNIRIEKYCKAEWAGTRKSNECYLILTEGDSAKSFALSGLEVIGRERYGVFPLRGKFLNVREATAKQLLENEEFKSLKSILGLKQGKKYKDTSKLNYNGIIILTDQDVDGSHIKGLLINLFHYYWPTLLKLDGFINSMATPIVKAFKKSDTKKENPIIFYNLTEYENWRQAVDASKWTVKYYKGLGTSDSKEAKQSFNDFENKLIKYIWEADNQNSEQNSDVSLDSPKKPSENDEANEELEGNDDDVEEEEEGDDLADMSSKSHDAITLAFEKSRANDRKNWLFSYNKENIIPNDQTLITYSEFVNKDLIHFSSYDNTRSIPSLCDGLKPSLRKILYGCFKRKLDKKEVKVAQLGAYVADNTGYHHGEASLFGAIINMAQIFVGSNNLNLLMPSGNFGNRRVGGKDAASPRYIFTQLNQLTRLLFKTEDDPIYNYNIEDNKKVEPETYAPILPVILINGSEGIGTGFSTNVPPFNPLDIAANLKLMLRGKDPVRMDPWFRGFKGTIKLLKDARYQTTGIYEIIGENQIRITELPVGVWTEKYLSFLETFLLGPGEKPAEVIVKGKNTKVVKNTSTLPSKFLTNITDTSGNNSINFVLSFYGNTMQQLLKSNDIIKKLKLANTISLNNMYLHNSSDIITKYETVDDILLDYYNFRLGVYEKRKAYRIRLIENELQIIQYRIKFIGQVIKDEIIIKKRKKSDIVQDLVKFKYPELSKKIAAVDDEVEDDEDDADQDDNEEEEEKKSDTKKSYKYLTDLPLFSLTDEKIADFASEYDDKLNELNNYKKITVETMWETDIDEFVNEYRIWIDEMNELMDDDDISGGKGGKKGKKGKKTVVKAKAKPKTTTK
jgi:DNA topoisomerase-2